MGYLRQITESPREGKDILDDVQRRLAADFYVDDSSIDVTVKDGRVILAGVVGTADDLFWSPYVDSHRVEVRVEAGQAVLKGRVTNRFVARAAVQNAFEGGAKTV